jgi:hypothetical protein
MDCFDLFCQLPLREQTFIVFSVVCMTALLTVLICAPRRNCFFLRWQPEARLLALLAAPTLLILWPVLLYGWFLRSRGIDPSDHDFMDD